MDRLYALGVSCIEFIQYWFVDWENYLTLVNHIANPHNVFEWLFPVVSILDSVFAAQLLLCMAFGSWLNAVMKWWLLEDRPYWWVRETSFYTTGQRPRLRQFPETCETGPGCPSGHTTTMSMLLVLGLMWISHVMNDRNWNITWWKCVVYPLFVIALLSVMLARMYVATHFPHQCLLGALIGSFLAPALCIYVSDPFVWRYGCHSVMSASRAVLWHVAAAGATVAIAALTYLSLKVCGWDPQWSVKLAFKWCENPEDIHVTTTPLFALVQSTGSLMGWALCVTPAVAQYRHYTRSRSLVISTFATALLVYGLRHLEEIVNKENAFSFYTANFIICVLKPILMLRVAPSLAMWPFQQRAVKSKKD